MTVLEWIADQIANNPGLKGCDPKALQDVFEYAKAEGMAHVSIQTAEANAEAHQSHRQIAEGVVDGYRADVLTGSAPGITLADMIEVSITDAVNDATADLLAACRKALNYIANTESELGITLDSGNALRAAIAKAEGSQS